MEKFHFKFYTFFKNMGIGVFLGQDISLRIFVMNLKIFKNKSKLDSQKRGDNKEIRIIWVEKTLVCFVILVNIGGFGKKAQKDLFLNLKMKKNVNFFIPNNIQIQDLKLSQFPMASCKRSNPILQNNSLVVICGQCNFGDSFCENMMISASYVILTVNFIFSSFQTPFEVFMI